MLSFKFINRETKESFVNKPKEITRAESMGTAYVGPVEASAQVLCEAGLSSFSDFRFYFETIN